MTDCQKVSGSPSLKHSAPKPNLYEETDHLAMRPISGHGRMGGTRAGFLLSIRTMIILEANFGA